jgi:uncharacterized membrane protein
MGHFKRWLEGFFIVIAGGAIMSGPPIFLLYVATIVPVIGLLFVIMAIMTFIAGIVLILYGRYIMKEEAPRGRFRVEQ